MANASKGNTLALEFAFEGKGICCYLWLSNGRHQKKQINSIFVNLFLCRACRTIHVVVTSHIYNAIQFQIHKKISLKYWEKDTIDIDCNETICKFVPT